MPFPQPESPPIWFRLPPGFHDFGLTALQGLDRTITEALSPVLGGVTAVDRALGEARSLASLVNALYNQSTKFTSLGFHPDGESGVCTSIFSLAVQATASRHPQMALARIGVSLARSPLWSTSECRVLDLPCGAPATLVAGTMTAPPTVLAQAGLSPVTNSVFQARLAVPYPGGSHVAVADLTSPVLRYADAYVDILEGVAHTIRFLDPEATSSPPPAGRPSRILEALA
ncbi:hypothetical protein [Streptomyces sp. SYSU K21746]